MLMIAFIGVRIRAHHRETRSWRGGRLGGRFGVGISPALRKGLQARIEARAPREARLSLRAARVRPRDRPSSSGGVRAAPVFCAGRTGRAATHATTKQPMARAGGSRGCGRGLPRARSPSRWGCLSRGTVGALLRSFTCLKATAASRHRPTRDGSSPTRHARVLEQFRGVDRAAIHWSGSIDRMRTVPGDPGRAARPGWHCARRRGRGPFETSVAQNTPRTDPSRRGGDSHTQARPGEMGSGRTRRSRTSCRDRCLKKTRSLTEVRP